jgi:N-acetyl-alpha-D-muramate 1-phosphate uridylyltransferase
MVRCRSLVGTAGCGLSASDFHDWRSDSGGALRQALPLLDSLFLVLYGDSHSPIDFSPIAWAFLSSGKAALVTVKRDADRWNKSIALFRDGAILEYNKPAPKPDMQYIDYGLGAISAQILKDENTTGPFDLADVYHRLSLSGRLAGERFYEIGSHKGLAEATDYFRGRGE